jgi:hypothetical protein
MPYPSAAHALRPIYPIAVSRCAVPLKTITDEIFAAHVKALEQWTDGDVCSWLLEGLSSGQFHRIPMLQDPSPSLQIEQLYNAASPGAQTSLKRGVSRALLEWTSAAFGYAVFGELARTAAHLRATESVRYISHHLLSAAFQERKAQDAKDAEDACEIAMAVLHGFAPHESLIPVFLKMYCSTQFERYGAHLFLGLCECEPERFAIYVPRFLEILNNHPEEFHLAPILRDFERIMPQELVQRRLGDLINEHSFFVDMLRMYTKIPLEPAPTSDPASSSQKSSRSELEAGRVFDYLYQRMQHGSIDDYTQEWAQALSERLH